MPSPRTETRDWLAAWRSFDARRLDRVGRLAQRLNVRLILSLGVVALIGLAVSGIAISQILPGYFIEQTQQRTSTAAGSTAVLLSQRFADAIEADPGFAVDPVGQELAAGRVAREAANLFYATINIVDPRGRVIGSANPPDEASLMAQGLRRDPLIEPEGRLVPVELPSGEVATYQVFLSQPYSARAETLDQIREALLASGLLALLVSFVTGVVAARTVTRPVNRLRGVSRRIAQGQLDERVPPSGVLEIDELGLQFNAMADRLAGTLRMLQADRDRLREFVADVSHELRTPIAALRMYNELLREGSVDEPTRAEFLQRSNDQIHRLEWLSTNLLDLSRIDAGIFPLDMRIGDLRDPIQAVVQAHSEVALARGIGLESTAPAQPVQMRFDRERIVQLLTNLVGNGLKFTPRGGLVAVRLTETESAAVIEVRDTGAGIPGDELPHVFERFYRGTNTGDARASGSGLGLAIVRSIVEMHGGDIDVASVVGEGTAFRITLPREPMVEPASAPPQVNETSPSDHRAPIATT